MDALPCGRDHRHYAHDLDTGERCPGARPATSLAELLYRRPELTDLPLPTITLNRLGVACA